MTGLEFYQTVEIILWGSRKFRPGALNGTDFAWLTAWLSEGISQKAILVGITRTLARYNPTKPDHYIRSMEYFQAEICDAERALREGQIGPERNRPGNKSC